MEEYEYMYEAIRKGDIKEVENFVAKASKEDINSVIKFYSNYDEGRYLLYSPLSTAVMYNQLEIAELLLKNGADPDTIGPDNNYDMNSVLNCAILNNNTSMVKLLLDYNGVKTFDVTKKTKNKLEAQINDNAVTRVYDALTNAVKNAYNQTKESITNADAVDIQLYQENNYSIPTKTTDIYVRTRFTKISSRKNETIIVPINISEVKKDADRNVSYFYIDSLIYNNKNLEYQKARVEVEGVDLTQAQVYAKFIKSGQDVNFVQLAQQNISNDEDDLVLF